MGLKSYGTFVLTDGSLDAHSERLLPEGGDFDRYRNTPVVFYNHHRSDHIWWANDVEGTRIMPIGRFENIRLENGQWLGELMLDDKDDFAMQVGDKIDSGILNAVSIGFWAKAWSEEEELMLPGQIGWTITKWEVFEISVVDIPANPNALRQNSATLSKAYKSGKGGETLPSKLVVYRTIKKVSSGRTKRRSSSKSSTMEFKELIGGLLNTTFKSDSAAKKALQGKSIEELLQQAINDQAETLVESVIEAMGIGEDENVGDGLKLMKKAGPKLIAHGKAIKAMTDKIGDQETEINELKSALEELEGKIEELANGAQKKNTKSTKQKKTAVNVGTQSDAEDDFEREYKAWMEKDKGKKAGAAGE